MRERPEGEDPWQLVLDEEFVRAGRPEPSAAERVAAAQRIARDHRRATGWRSGPPPLRPRAAGTGDHRDHRGRPRASRAGRSLLAVLVGLCVALAAVTWWVERPREPLGRPAPAPAGSGGYVFSALLDDGSGRPVTFDPCAPIRYVVRPDGQPPSGEAMLEIALAEVSHATGLSFAPDGLTSEAPDLQGRSAGPWPADGRAAPVLVAWSTEAETPELAGNVAGVAGPVRITPDGPGSERYVTGQVVLDAADLAHAPGDVAAEETVRLVLMHELAHLVGLGHVDDPTQLMHAETRALPGSRGGFGDGDLRGLHALGQGRCA